jgi:hypothetical protein
MSYLGWFNVFGPSICLKVKMVRIWQAFTVVTEVPAPGLVTGGYGLFAVASVLQFHHKSYHYVFQSSLSGGVKLNQVLYI